MFRLDQTPAPNSSAMARRAILLAATRRRQGPPWDESRERGKARPPPLHASSLLVAKGTSRFSLRRARASRPRGGRRRSCSWRSSRPAAPGPAITSSPSGRAGMVGVSDGCDRDGDVAGQGAWAAAHLGSGASSPTVVSDSRSCSESGGSTRCGYRDRCVERETERLPLVLGGQLVRLDGRWMGR
jgi:hypothetical protein